MNADKVVATLARPHTRTYKHTLSHTHKHTHTHTHTSCLRISAYVEERGCLYTEKYVHDTHESQTYMCVYMCASVCVASHVRTSFACTWIQCTPVKTSRLSRKETIKCLWCPPREAFHSCYQRREVQQRSLADSEDDDKVHLAVTPCPPPNQ